MNSRPDDVRWPAEWEPHDGTLLAWPVNEATWPGRFDRIASAFARFVAQVTQFEPVWILAGHPEVTAAAGRLIQQACERQASRYPVHFLDIPVNDSWCRDYGPMVLTGPAKEEHRPRACALDWDWNAWGARYPPWNLDAQVAGAVARWFEMPLEKPGVVLEGGAVEGNGRGTVLTM